MDSRAWWASLIQRVAELDMTEATLHAARTYIYQADNTTNIILRKILAHLHEETV